MPRLPLSRRTLVLLAPSLLCVAPAAAQRFKPVPEPVTGISANGGGECPFPAGAHPLSFWTKNPLARACGVGLAIGLPAATDGRPITRQDFHVDQTLTTLGILAGHKIMQIKLLIRPVSRGIAQGNILDPDNSDARNTQWKTLLVQTGNGDSYRQFYGVQLSIGTAWPFQSAAIYGTGEDRILATYEPDTGNGGGCWEGYWWFDHRGPHPADFAPLDRAIRPKIPPNTSYVGRCGAIDPKTNSLRSGVQRLDAECHACGFVGGIAATYRIHHGKAKAVAITFTPDQPGQ